MAMSKSRDLHLTSYTVTARCGRTRLKMAATGQEMRGRSSAEFVDDTILEAFVPAASRVNVQELLEAWDGEVLEDKNTIVPFIEQRQFLLLGSYRSDITSDNTCS